MAQELHVVCGGAGCIGSELVRALLAQGHKVRVLDNLSTGRIEHLQEFMDNPNFYFRQMDAGAGWGPAGLAVEFSGGVHMVWHLAAKTDIKFTEGYNYDADLGDNLITTWAVLRVMRAKQIKRLAFASSAAVYGDYPVLIEDTVMPEPVSMYGATKLACEAIIRAMAFRTGMQAWMFRYCSIVSRKARKSGNMVIPDLIHKLRRDPTQLEILGDGNQTKPSLLVDECVEAMLYIVNHVKDPVSIHNIGAADTISVTRQAELICAAMGLDGVKFNYTGGTGGWPGDVPSFRMDVQKLGHAGWRAKHTSEQAVKIAIRGLLESGE